jgi:hypothetical protein
MRRLLSLLLTSLVRISCCACRVQTSYVTVEPKRRKQAPQQEEQEQEEGGTQSVPGTSSSEATGSQSRPPSAQTSAKAASPEHEEEGRSSAGLPPARQGARGSSSGGRELRRARIEITVKRTESYKRWLEENPHQAIITGDADETDPERTLRESK